MNKKLSVFILAMFLSVGAFIGSGCDSEKVLGFLNLTSQEAPETIDKSETVIVALEDATGKTIPIEISTKGEAVSGKVANLASKGQAAVATLKAFVPQASPYADTAYTILGVIGSLAGAAGTFFSRRKAKAAELETKTMIKAVDNVAGIGAKITEAAALDGTAKGIKQKYVEVKVNG